MSDHQLTIAAASVEICVVALVLWAFLVGKLARRRTVVVLGALTPAVLVMVGTAYAQFFDSSPGSMASAGWIMGFAAYGVVLVGGAVVSLVPRPTNLFGRYLLGLASAPLFVGSLLWIEGAFRDV